MINRFTHVGIAVHELDAAVAAWSEQFGLEVLHRLDVEIEGLRTVMLGSPDDPGGFCIELLSPLDPTDPTNQVVRFLAKRGEGLFHLAATATVADVDDAAERLSARHVTIVPSPPGPIGPALAAAVDETADRVIVAPRSANGVLVELLQARS